MCVLCVRVCKAGVRCSWGKGEVAEENKQLDLFITHIPSMTFPSKAQGSPILQYIM